MRHYFSGTLTFRPVRHILYYNTERKWIDYLPKGSHGIINDLGAALSHTVPVNENVAVVTLTVVGSITGLDGSGFSGVFLKIFIDLDLTGILNIQKDFI